MWMATSGLNEAGKCGTKTAIRYLHLAVAGVAAPAAIFVLQTRAILVLVMLLAEGARREDCRCIGGARPP
jgi:hypothetical protein